jgi:NAD(P)-dependent dehydrogenase (short-subunit alcohol dehydrogenase family)
MASFLLFDCLRVQPSCFQRSRCELAEFFDFKDHTVFVAGGSSGINLGIAEGFAARGARLAIISRSQERVDAAVRQLETHGGDAMGMAADVRNPDAVEQALAAVHGKWGTIDVLISGAAGNFPAAALGVSPNGFRTVVDIDLNGTFNVLRLAQPYLKRPGASVINISAPQSFVPTKFQAHVCAAKAGVDMLTRVLAMEWGEDGVRVNSIVPGPIEGTEGIRRLVPTQDAMDRMLKTVPLGRLGTKTDIANMALFLSSPLCSYVTGAVIPVDGGRSLGGGSDLSAAVAPRENDA